MIQVFDGEKGYMVNPMTGSSEPVEMTADQVKEVGKEQYVQQLYGPVPERREAHS